MDENEELNVILKNIQTDLVKKDLLPGNFDQLRSSFLYSQQCMYVLNYIDQSVPFQRGVEKMLGYSANEFNFDFVLNNYHPDDIRIVQRVIGAAIKYNSENEVRSRSLLKLCYRTRKKNGDYIKVMRTSSNFEMNEKGNMVSNVSTLTDISFLNMGNKVEWYFESGDLDQIKFRKLIEKSFAKYFSERQKEIIRLLALGNSSLSIARALSISRHTVDTHRRAMLKKANCQNTIELLNFCRQNGIR